MEDSDNKLVSGGTGFKVSLNVTKSGNAYPILGDELDILEKYDSRSFWLNTISISSSVLVSFLIAAFTYDGQSEMKRIVFLCISALSLGFLVASILGFLKSRSSVKDIFKKIRECR